MVRAAKRFKAMPRNAGDGDDGEAEKVVASHTVLLTLENNKRYAHTATSSYQIKMASLQPDERRLPHCVCNSINDEKRPKRESDDRVIVIIEHNLNEYILCMLDSNKLRECKLNLVIRPGEQIAFRTIGRVPVLLSGISAKPTCFLP